ncbi:oxysterol-binding -related 8-like isoform X6 [Labeo rohita]|uniref:Oxysterol-binding-related 8-like isoform X6 n=1 Tax=Labeo rohita TaxID=84645 RepID=A0A498MNA8_LABRO|nr:oxysterol-binding -related 8-like isoform X6 [Labeo rohita]
MRRSGQEAQHNSDLRMMHESAAARRRTNAFALGEHAIGDVQMEGHNRPEDMEIKMKKWDVCDRSVSETKLYNGSDKDVSASGNKLTKKESLKVQKKNYREEKKRATKELLSTITDPSVIVMADWLKIRGTLKSWTKLWCVLKPGVLLIYKTNKNGQWVGTVLLNACELIERPSKKDGFCFKLFHPLEQSIWAVKGPKGEAVGSITQPLPSSHLIFRAASESDGETETHTHTQTYRKSAVCY